MLNEKGFRVFGIMIMAAALFAAVITFGAVTTALTAEAPLVAVLPFEEGDLMWKGFRSEEILNGITQLVTDKLVEKEGIRVVERSRINDILNEQDFGQSGRVDPATAAEIGRILGVDALILGTLTRMEVAESGAISIGFISVSGIKASVVLSGRVVDTTTAEILGSLKGEAEAEDASINITIKEMEGLTFGSKTFSNSVLGKCIEEAVDNFVDNLDPDSIVYHPGGYQAGGYHPGEYPPGDYHPGEYPPEDYPPGDYHAAVYLDAMVLYVINDNLVIDVGSRQNIVENQTGQLIRLQRVEGQSAPVEMPIGRVRVYSVDRNASLVRIIEMKQGERPVEGDVVEFEIRP